MKKIVLFACIACLVMFTNYSVAQCRSRNCPRGYGCRYSGRYGYNSMYYPGQRSYRGNPPRNCYPYPVCGGNSQYYLGSQRIGSAPINIHGYQIGSQPINIHGNPIGSQPINIHGNPIGSRPMFHR